MGANSCLSILPSDVLMGRCEPSGRGGGDSRNGSVLWCTECFLGFTPLLQQETRHGRCQQSVLARSLSSLTLFTQSSQQLSQAPSIVTQDTLLWNTPRAWNSFNILFFVCFLFYCSFFCSLLFSECWLPAVHMLVVEKEISSLRKRSKSICFPFFFFFFWNLTHF